ncbi:hypothetical protein BS78_04G106800, partial [Paspalum vaginatum]
MGRTARTPAELMDVIVTEILVRLPVKSLLQFRSVCKAWRALISDPTFVTAQLRHSASKREQAPCFTISPHTLRMSQSGLTNHFRFYLWHLQGPGGDPRKDQPAWFLHDKCLRVQNRARLRALRRPGARTHRHQALYVFNPATRDAITLPESQRRNKELQILFAGVVDETKRCQCAGLGLDPRTGNYKVVRAFYRPVDRMRPANMGMEVFTIGGDAACREILNDPPFPAMGTQTAVAVAGFMFWRLKPFVKDRPHGILHLSLEEEEFGITALPDSMYPPLVDIAVLDVLYGRDLCLTVCTDHTCLSIFFFFFLKRNGCLSIWTLPVAEKGAKARSLPPISDGIILWCRCAIYRYNPSAAVSDNKLSIVSDLHQ